MQELAHQQITIHPGEVRLRVNQADIAALDASTKRTLPGESTTAAVLDLKCSLAKLKVDISSAHFLVESDLGLVKLDFADAASELVLGSAIAWEAAGRLMADRCSKAAELEQTRQQYLFVDLARLSSQPLAPTEAGLSSKYETEDADFFTSASPLLDNSLHSLRLDRGWQVHTFAGSRSI